MRTDRQTWRSYKRRFRNFAKAPKKQFNSVLRHVLRGKSWKSTLKLCRELPSISLPSHHAVILLQVSSVYRGTLYLYTARPSISGTGWSAKDDNRDLTTPIIFYSLTTWQHPTPSATVRSLITFFLHCQSYFFPIAWELSDGTSYEMALPCQPSVRSQLSA